MVTALICAPRHMIPGSARDAGHEYNGRGFGPAQLDQSSRSSAAIRGREQQLIDYYRGRGISTRYSRNRPGKSKPGAVYAGSARHVWTDIMDPSSRLAWT